MIQPQRLNKLFRHMVDIYSPSGKENDVLDFLKGYLKRRGISAIVQPVDENRYNLLVMPESDDIRLAFIGHVDTVAAYDLENYGYEREGDIINGLGTADMKGGCAAIIEAFMAFKETRDFFPPVALCMVVGEEETGDGAAQLVKNYNFPWAVIGEPTDLIPCLSSYGYMEIQIASRGRRMHASLANRRENAVEAMLHTMLRISHYMKQERPELVCNIRDLSSIRTGFTVPERCEAWLDIHLPPAAPMGEIITDLEEVSVSHPDVSSEIEILFQTTIIDGGYDLPEKGAIAEALKTVYARHNLTWQTTPFRSHSDANQLWAAGVKPIILGPGQLEKAHAQDESVSFKQVCLAAEIYLDVMLHLFGNQK